MIGSRHWSSFEGRFFIIVLLKVKVYMRFLSLMFYLLLLIYNLLIIPSE